MEIYKGRELIKEAVNDIADAVVQTMGPEGGTVIVSDFKGDPNITKDGVTVSNSINFKDPVKNLIAKIIKEVAQLTVKQAGDGTTTATCLVRELINKGHELELSQRELKKELEKLEDLLVEELFKVTSPLEKEDLYNVAYISSNGDSSMAKIICEAYEHSDIIHIQEESISKDALETIDGFRIDGSYMDVAFVNNVKRQSIEYDKCTFFVIDGKLTDIELIKPFLAVEQQYPVIFMADHVSASIMDIFKRNYNEGHLAIGVLKSPGFGGHRRNLVKDIVAYTGCKKRNDKLYIGEIDSICADEHTITIGKQNAEVAYLEDLKESYNEDAPNANLIEQRISALSGKLSIINVGGISETERKERKDRMEDAVLAVHSALEEGTVPGAGFALYNIAEKYKDDNKFIDCVKKPYEIISSSVNEIDYSKVIDPAKVTRCAVQNAISVAKTLLSTDTVVLNPILWN